VLRQSLPPDVIPAYDGMRLLAEPSPSPPAKSV
jgi:hypothetical protein